jgi:hypothetical protein
MCRYLAAVGGVQGRRDIEMAGGAAGGLQGDEGHLAHDADRNDDAGDGDEDPVPAEEREQVDEREAVEPEGEGELRRLESSRRAGDDLPIHSQADHGDEQGESHRQPGDGERRVDGERPAERGARIAREPARTRA